VGLLLPCSHMLRIPTPVRAMALSVDTRSSRSYSFAALGPAEVRVIGQFEQRDTTVVRQTTVR